MHNRDDVICQKVHGVPDDLCPLRNLGRFEEVGRIQNNAEDTSFEQCKVTQLLDKGKTRTH
jgi:hypothetical protein